MRGFPVSTVCVTDGDLVARARNGDHAAFGDLVNRHRVAVFRAAMAVLGSHADAEDAAQDAFVVAWRRLESFRGESSFKTWLLTIAWHQAINRRRGLTQWWKRMMSMEEKVGVGPTYERQIAASNVGRTLSGSPGDRGTPEEVVAAVELRQDIAKAIRALTPKLRDTLLLAQSGDCSYEEIGRIVGAPVGTIKWRISEARRQVKQRLQQLGHGEPG
jgi:RNA polymerase sigma-70 factor, ECF subfamily